MHEVFLEMRERFTETRIYYRNILYIPFFACEYPWRVRADSSPTILIVINQLIGGNTW